ncbi:MAG TPA: OmpA family protein [Stellaceae bacterium]|jgi:opacity protein-like surface antigen
MKTIHGALIGGAFLLATASTSFAQSAMSWVPYGVYVRGDLGAAFGTDAKFKDTAPTSPSSFLGTTTLNSTVDTSVIFGGGIGYRFNPMFRSDFTLDYIPSHNVKGHDSLAPTVTNSGNVSSLVGMLNGYLDLNGFAPTLFGPFQPYLQAGVGFANNDLSRTNISLAAGPFVAAGSYSGNTDTDFAWGAGAGVGYPVTPNLTLDLGYKYLDLGEMRSGTSFTAAGFTVPVTQIKADLHVHTVMIGLRWAFGAPAAPTPVAAPPAPPPAAAVPAQQMFIVFFEFDKSALTADGRKVVDAAAAAFKSGKSGIAISGYTDLAGTQQYNLALSKRRADTVKAALVRDGVPVSAIDESWHGKENPRVPTADGVREPQNRRVEITM